jgi:hypothetical protein
MVITIDMTILRLQMNDLLYTMDYFIGREHSKLAKECLRNLSLVYLFPSMYTSSDCEYIEALKSVIKRLQRLETSCEFTYSIYNDAAEVIKLITLLEQELLK